MKKMAPVYVSAWLGPGEVAAIKTPSAPKASTSPPMTPKTIRTMRPIGAQSRAQDLDSRQLMPQTTLPPADLLPVRREATLSYRLVRLVGVPLLHLVFRFDVTGRENIPRSGNYIVIANHLNWLDEFAILLLFPVQPRIHFLADPTLLITRKVQWFSVRHTGGCVPVIRERHGDPALFRHVDRALEVGGAVAIFPEGNYGPTEGELMPFKKGFAHLAGKAGVPGIPSALSGPKTPWL